MKKQFLLSIPLSLFLMLSLAMSPAGSSSKTDAITVDNFRLERMNFKNTDHGWYLLKCDVTNTGQKSGTVGVTLRSIDTFAYYRKDIQLWGHLKAGQPATLSLTRYMDYKTLQGIRTWKVKDPQVHHMLRFDSHIPIPAQPGDA